MPPSQLSLPEATPRDPSSKATTTEPQFSTSPQPVSMLAAAPPSLATREQFEGTLQAGRVEPVLAVEEASPRRLAGVANRSGLITGHTPLCVGRASSHLRIARVRTEILPRVRGERLGAQDVKTRPGSPLREGAVQRIGDTQVHEVHVPTVDHLVDAFPDHLDCVARRPGYERVMRFVVWGTVLCFGAVVLRTGIDDPGALLRGFLAFEIPGDRNGIAGATLVLSGLSAAVGINMLFLYPYSLRARGWGREHRRLARLDLGVGTFLPYVLAMSLIVIATANTLHLDPDYAGTRLSPVEAASSLAGLLVTEWGRVAFGVGVLGMVLSSLTLHMVSAGFVCAEVFGWPLGSRRHSLATLIPLPGFLGCLLWTEIAIWIAVPTNIICGLLLPVVYLGFTRLQRSRAYLGEDVPSGPGGRFWIAGMCLATGVLAIFFFWYLLTR